MTHFANSEAEDHPALSVAEQLRRFDSATQGLKGDRNLSNSGAVLPSSRYPYRLGASRASCYMAGHRVAKRLNNTD